jgi:endonuclease YncB( thermonuclease family)
VGIGAWTLVSPARNHRGPVTIKLFLPIVLVLSLFSRGWTDGFSGPVVSVLDGDTIEVLHYTHPERIRLSGIDCPEKGQPGLPKV